MGLSPPHEIPSIVPSTAFYLLLAHSTICRFIFQIILTGNCKKIKGPQLTSYPPFHVVYVEPHQRNRNRNVIQQCCSAMPTNPLVDDIADVDTDDDQTSQSEEDISVIGDEDHEDQCKKLNLIKENIYIQKCNTYAILQTKQ